MYFFPLFFCDLFVSVCRCFHHPRPSFNNATLPEPIRRVYVCGFPFVFRVRVLVSSARALSLSEENVWKLCEQVKKTRPSELSKCYAVFVSNEGRTVPLWRQKAGRGDDKVVIWVSDLHSIFLGFSCSLYDDYVPAPNTVAFKRSNSNIV